MASRSKNSLSCHPEEQALLHGIVAHPDDTARWLILADWLEEHDDPRRAELLRLHRQLIATCCAPGEYLERASWQARLVELLSAGVYPSVPRQAVTLAEGVEITLAWVPPGSFLMGSPAAEKQRVKDESRHRVTLTEGFWLGVAPVTQVQWRAVMPTNPSSFQGDDLPVEYVSWEDCQNFCRMLRKREGKAYRLATEAEWEYGCRSGTTTPFFWGETLSTEQANYDGSSSYGTGTKGKHRQRTTAAVSFPCNGWGLYDMHGNVLEWCQDWYGKYHTGPVRDPRGPGRATYRVLRGGSWNHPPNHCRSSHRNRQLPSTRYATMGCRLALTQDC